VRLPQADALLATDAPARLATARAAADSRLNAIEVGNDVAALGTPEEREQWARIQHMEDLASAMPPGLERDESADKLRLIKGVLYWRLDADFKQRSYDQRRALQDLDAQLQELQNRWVRVQRARATVPTNTDEFAARIAALADRIKSVRERLAESSQQQSQYLATLAQSELQSQRDRLATYALQARVQLADIYDRSADENQKAGKAPDSTATPPSPAPKPEPEPK
jgi:septal ring factor EnvC (AmiA/AmiB activator)